MLFVGIDIIALVKDNKLTIQIKRTANDVFAFTINPKNTPLWISSIVKEETSDWPVKTGTFYKNQNRVGKWTEYTVYAIKENEVFELASKDKNYHVRYTYKALDGKTCKLEYYEWVDKGELEEPFSLARLKKLKNVVERSRKRLDG